jgi:hypothetical protein
MRHSTRLLLWITFGIALGAVSTLGAQDLKVNGNLRVSGAVTTLDKDGFVFGTFRIGPISSVSGAAINGNPTTNGHPVSAAERIAIDRFFGVNRLTQLSVAGDTAIFGNQTTNGNELINGDESFGARTRQMINLFGAGYGIGVQDSGFYQRTDRDFFWYRGGKHSDTSGDSGGGAELLRLGPGGLSFGARTRQMLNLFGAGYGIGVQDSGFYERSDFAFFWYKGGLHSDTFGDGGGGTQLMKLDPNGLTAVGRIVTPVLEITGGNDVAEPFQISPSGALPGSVVIIDADNPGQLKLSEVAYDRRVAGIVSGANGINAGISLSQAGASAGGQNVALSGRVYVLADASSNPIRPGDLLTTSETPGYAMKVTDYARAPGAVIGKAMSALDGGTGMVLVLVTLQ